MNMALDRFEVALLRLRQGRRNVDALIVCVEEDPVAEVLLDAEFDGLEDAIREYARCHYGLHVRKRGRKGKV
jgi:hypothetical protein